jgi:hypothetical protein
MRTILLAVVLALLCSVSAASDAAKSATPIVFNMEAVAKIQVGTTTAADVEQLLGKPYRMTNYGDCSPIDYQEFWEYAVRNADGWFRIHIEFDEDHIARLITRVPSNGPIQVLAAAPKPTAHHH